MRHAVEQLAPAGKGGEEVGQRLAGPGRELVAVGELARRAVKRGAVASRHLVQPLHRALADAALGHIDDPLEGEIVVGRHHHPEIGHRVADFLPFVEARAADHPVRQAERDEPVLESPHLERGAHQDCDVVEAFAAALELLDVVADGARFLVAIPVTAQGDELALVELRPQRLAEPALVLGDEPGGSAKYMRRGTVVLLQPDNACPRKILLEAQDVVDLCTAPAIDRLVVIADTTDILPTLTEQSQPKILRNIGVLIFVDQHVLEPPLIVGENVGIVLEQPQASSSRSPKSQALSSFRRSW